MNTARTLLGYLKSRTVWAIIALVVINGVEGVRELLPVNFLPIVDALLGLAAIYFRVKPKQTF